MAKPNRISKSAIFWTGAIFATIAAVLGGFFARLIPGEICAATLAVLAIVIIAAGAFRLAIELFANSGFIAKQTAISLEDGESVAYQGVANHFLNGEGRGGRLYLTNRRLVFQPHKFNFQREAISIPRADIASVSACLTFGLIPNGMKVLCRDGTSEQFVVSHRSQWLQKIADVVT